jgi:hypothetical protein
VKKIFGTRYCFSETHPIKLEHPQTVEFLEVRQVKDDIARVRQRSKMYYDQCAKPLPDLNLGQEVYVRLKPNDNYRKELVRNSYRRNREHMIPFQSKIAVFDNLGEGKEPIESAITQRQDDDVRSCEMQANYG